jgi:8-oxo-dGTP pyrophosphatase MutT (NUDIX family)
VTSLPFPARLGTVVERLRARRFPPPAEEGASAAVATIFRQGPTGPEVLFIERATHDGDPWSGHIAFPGGKRDPDDAALLDTAVRETHEEVGLALGPSQLVVRFEDFYARTNGYQVAQFVFALDGDGGALAPNPEVAAVLWTPLDALVAPENATTYAFDREGVTLELPAVHLGSRVLWGMTLRMTQVLLDAIAGQ